MDNREISLIDIMEKIDKIVFTNKDCISNALLNNNKEDIEELFKLNVNCPIIVDINSEYHDYLITVCYDSKTQSITTPSKIIPSVGDRCFTYLYDKDLDKFNKYDSFIIEVVSNNEPHFNDIIEELQLQAIGDTRGFATVNSIEQNYCCMELVEIELDRDLEKEYTYHKRIEEMAEALSLNNAVKDTPLEDYYIDNYRNPNEFSFDDEFNFYIKEPKEEPDDDYYFER